MDFTKAFYVNFGYPDNECTLRILEYYITGGAKTFIFDLPSENPYLEKEYIQQNMHYILFHQGIIGVMQGISAFKRIHPDTEVCLIVYADTIEAVSTAEFTAWCSTNGIRHLGLISKKDEKQIHAALRDAGIAPNISAEYSLPAAMKTGIRGDELITIQAGKSGTELRGSLAERIRSVQSEVPGNTIWAEMGIQTPDDIRVVRNCGANGAIIGTSAMQLWGTPELLKEYVKEICEA